ncbi:MAG TPA: helix-turn-helix domain-containing protein [Streptosporangiaceae bacterium]|jgi:AraC-like DNA-binding protein
MDVTPGYREMAPGAAFGHQIDCVWVRVQPPEPGGRTLVLPDACADLIWQRGVGAYVAGPDTGPAPVSHAPGLVMAGVRFRPGAGGAALGLPLSELLNQRVPASELPGLPARQLPGSLPLDLAVRALTQLAASLVTDRPPDPVAVQAARLLARPGARAEQVAARLDISERQLRRRCQAAVGYGPRTLHRVLRFRRFLASLHGGRLGAGGPDGLASLAADAGYADQAHLTRESARLAGLPPAALARELDG